MSQFDIDDDDTLPVSPTYAGFQRWIRTPLDDVPPIKPPKRHMLSNVTGGLNSLYICIKKEDEEKKRIEEEAALKEQEILKLQEEEKKKREAEKAIALKKLEGNGEIDEDGETSPYTDEVGEFCPDNTLPLLALRYKYVEVLAKGQSALIIKALDTFCKDRPVAIKVLHREYKPIGSQEADILLELHRADPWLHVPFARLINQFIYGPHYCLVFDCMSPIPLYNHYDQREIKGSKSLTHVRNLCVKLLTVMGFLHKQNVIHADLKPENILLVNETDMSSVMVIDFGNALRNTEDELSLYYSDFELQTLLYRAPEVIFGLKFSLEIDMWSLGCLLAECYTGEPLFVGKTKDDILSKITKLLGPFPNDFKRGECAEEFSEFIGTAWTKHQRLENLRKKLGNCQDISFLLILERLLTYKPEQRISPFQAACHPFIASVNPFLYLSSSEELKRYPTVVLDGSTYPYVPDIKSDSENENPKVVKSRNRLASYSKPKTSSALVSEVEPKSVSDSKSVPETKKPTPEPNVIVAPKPIFKPIPTYEPKSFESKSAFEKKIIVEKKPTVEKSPTVEKKPVFEKKPIVEPKPCLEKKVIAATKQCLEAKPTVESKPGTESKQPSEPKPSTESKPLPEPKSNKSEELRSSTPIPSESERDGSPHPEKSFEEISKPSTTPTSQPESLTSPTRSMDNPGTPLLSPVDSLSHVSPNQSPEPKFVVERKSKLPPTKEDLITQAKLREKMKESANLSRTDVKQTLKSMGLKCEDFTISVYSKEQAHAILRKQGVEVTNHGPPKIQRPTPRQGKSNIRPSVSVLRTDTNPKPVPKKKVEDDDDDDCIILDPPEGTKVPPPPPPARRFPQQFQLMGTTVQVNRGAKRQMRGMNRYAPMAKRQHRNQLYSYNDRYGNYDEPPETSVQDTLKRLKNYNISITCRRNTNQSQKESDDELDPRDQMMDSEDDEEDLTKYLECEIDEPREDDPLDMDSSGSVADASFEDRSPMKKQNRNGEDLNKTVDLGEETPKKSSTNSKNLTDNDEMEQDSESGEVDKDAVLTSKKFDIDSIKGGKSPSDVSKDPGEELSNSSKKMISEAKKDSLKSPGDPNEQSEEVNKNNDEIKGDDSNQAFDELNQISESKKNSTDLKLALDEEHKKTTKELLTNVSKKIEEVKSSNDSKPTEDEEINEELENQLLEDTNEPEMDAECLGNMELDSEL